MTSIRGALMLFYSVLLGVALTAVSILVYNETYKTLEAREKSRAELIFAVFEDNCQAERTRLDTILLDQARILASQAQVQFAPGQNYPLAMIPLNSLSGGLAPTSLLLVPVLASAWLPPDRGSQISAHFFRRTFSKIIFDEGLVHRQPEGIVKEYFQINTSYEHSWRSRSMGDLSFEFVRNKVRAMQMLDPHHDDVELNPGQMLRRVTVKTPAAAQFRWGPVRGSRPNQASERTSRGGVDQRPEEQRPVGPPKPQGPPGFSLARSMDWMYIQCAAESTFRDASIARHRDSYNADLDELRKETRDTLGSLRNRLLTISLSTFLAATAGGLFLVRLGLAPLQRLSDAVSRISPPEFKLPYDEKKLAVELRPIVDRLNGTLSQLKRAFGREKQAAADISHELRTPLSALLTTVEVTLKKQRTEERYRDALSDCHAAGKQMSRLVERLLILARLDAGADPLKSSVVDAVLVAEQCVNLVRPLAESRGLHLSMRGVGPMTMETDPDKFREVVTNLLHNAIEYNRPDGDVALAMERVNGHLHLEVRDTGIGISRVAREHIFERFYREDRSRRAEGCHSGLGLAIVKGFVDLMGGSIDVQSEVGMGSTFRLRLPVARPGNARTASERNDQE